MVIPSPREREPSDVAEQAAQLSAELDEIEASGSRRRRSEAALEAHRRRISYFMLFRLGLLSALTLAVTWTTWLRPDYVAGLREWLAWAVVAAGYVLTLVYAAWLRRARKLMRVAWVQTSCDILLATAAVLLTGGIASGFVFLFLIAILGAATMADRRLIWTAAGVCGALYVAIVFGQLLAWFQLPDPNLQLTSISLTEVWLSLLRTSAAIGLVAMLSAYLNSQLLSSVSQVGSLRALNENIVRSLTSGLLTIDQNGRVLFANPTARELLGLRGELAGLDSDELLPGVRAHLDDSGGFRNRFELEIQRRDDGRRIALGLSCSPLLDEDGRFLGHVINFNDVTEVREMERVLRRNERLAAIGGLAASVAHEVRNPLAAISGCAELLATEVQGEENERLLRVVRSETSRLANIVSELLDYTRPRTLQRSHVDLRRLLDELADGLRADPGHAKIELVLGLPKEPVEADIDATQLAQVLWNLVRNAVQAMGGQGRLELGLAQTRDEVRLSVRDHGIGIPDEDIERIFEPFFSKKEGGSGIGLALVHRIVEEHGGAIQVHSIVGEGTQFVIRLPRKG